MNLLQQQQQAQVFDGDQDIKEASFQEALKYRDNNMVMRSLPGDKFEPFNIMVNDEELAQFGIGLTLFFKFVKYSIIAFLVMALISLPSLISNLLGDGLQQNKLNKNSLSLFTLANQPQPTVITPNSSSTASEIAAIQVLNDASLQSWMDEMSTRQYYIIIPDIIYSVFFFAFCFWMKKQSEKIKSKVSEESVAPSNYALEVIGFPCDGQVNENDIKKYFTDQNLGQIQECYFIRNYYGTLDLYKRSADLLTQLKIENKRKEMLSARNQAKQSRETEKKIEQIKMQHNQVQLNIQQQIKLNPYVQNRQFPAIRAIVVFNSLVDKEKCVEKYAVYDRFCAPKQPSNMLFQGKYPLRMVSNVDEPSNIKWENLDISSNNRRLRTCCVYTIALVLMCITFAIIIVANVIKPTNQQSCPTQTIELFQVQNSTSSVMKECYCQQQSPQTIIDDKTIQEMCWDTYIKLLTQVLLTIFTGFVIFIVNFLLQILIKAISAFQKYKTNSDEQSGQTVKLFTMQFINTALITLIMQANFFGFIPAIFISNIIPPIKELQQYNENSFYSDFNRGWYLEVGSKITTAMIINIFSPHLIRLSLLPITRCFRQSSAKSATIQRDMNNLIVGQEFELTIYYVTVLNTIFCTLFYCGGMPLLLWLAVISLAMQYITAKTFLLKFNKKPPIYDAKINKLILRFLPYSILLHMCISLYMYGQPLIFPNTKSSTQSEINSNFQSSEITVSAFPSTGDQDLIIIARVLYKQIIYLIILVVLAGIQVVSVTFRLFFMKVIKFIFCLKKQTQVKPAKEFGTYEEEYVNMAKVMLASYDPRQNSKYTELINALHLQDEQQQPQPQTDILDSHKPNSIGPSCNKVQDAPEQQSFQAKDEDHPLKGEAPQHLASNEADKEVKQNHVQDSNKNQRPEDLINSLDQLAK